MYVDKIISVEPDAHGHKNRPYSAALNRDELGRHIADISASFWAGFTQPTRVALFMMPVVLGLTCLTIFNSVTPAALAGSLGRYLPIAGDDANGFATREALRIAHGNEVPVGSSHIFIPGNSIIAQAFASDLKLKQNLEVETGKSWNVTFLTTPLQGALDEIALLDVATRKHPGVVVLSASPDRLNSDVNHLLKYYRYGRLGFRSERADQQVEHILKAPPRRHTGIYLVDNRPFFSWNGLPMAQRAIARWPAQRKIDIYLLPQTAASQRKLKAEALKNHRPGQVAVSLLTDSVAFLKARGNRILFFRVPISPATLTSPRDRQLYEIHRQEMRRYPHALAVHIAIWLTRNRPQLPRFGIRTTSRILYGSTAFVSGSLNVSPWQSEATERAV